MSDKKSDPSSPQGDVSNTESEEGGLLAQVRESYLLRFAVALMAAVVVVGVAGVAVQAETSEQLQTDVENQLEQEARSEAATLASTVGRTNSKVVIAADHPAFNGDNETRQAYVERLLDRQLTEDAQAVHIVDTVDNRIVASTDESRINTPSTDAAWSGTDVDIGVTRRTDPFTNANGERVVGVTSVSPRDLQTMLVVEFSAERQSEQFSSGIDGTFTEVVKPTSDGTEVIFSNYPDADTTGGPYVPNRSANDIPAVTDADANGNYLDNPAKSETLDEEYIAAAATVEGTNWVVVKHVPRANAFALSRSVRQGILLLIGLAIVGVSVIGATIGRTTVGSLRDLSEKATAIEDGDYEVDLDSDRRDEIGQLYASVDNMRRTLVDRLEAAEQAEVDAEEARQEAERINDRLIERAEQFSDVMAACADGDLTRRMSSDTDVPAMESIADSFNEMVARWEETMISIREFGETVNGLSDEAANNVEEIRTVSEQVSQSTQTITETVNRQDERAQTASEETADLSATVEEITSTTESVAASAEQTADRGDRGQQAAESAIDELDAIQEQSAVAVETVDQLSERMSEIEEIVDFITEIAEQTNTLALNANIEAARAGGDGDGFAVVAQEVKSLAEETKEATEEIDELVTNIRERTDATVDDMTDVQTRVDEGTATVEEALTALDEIAAQARETSDGMEQIQTATQQQASAAQNVARLADELSDLTREAATEAETVAASTEEQTASINELSRQVSTLSERTAELNERIGQFSVSNTADQTTVPSSVTAEADGGVSSEPE